MAKTSYKKRFIYRVVDVPKTPPKGFWAKEMKILNMLEKRYSAEFLIGFSFGRKVDSLALIYSEALRPEMDALFKASLYRSDMKKYRIPPIHKEKFGEDIPWKRPTKTLRQFILGNDKKN